MAFVSATALVCEKVILERDNAPTLIRIVDTFFVPEDAPLLTTGEKLAVGMTLFAQIKITPDDDSEHEIKLILVRPDGSETPMNAVTQVASASLILPEAERSYTVAAQMGVKPTHYGEHVFHVKFDGQIVASAKFFITLPPVSSEPVLHAAN